MVPQSSEDQVHRRQDRGGKASEGVYAVHPFGLSQESCLNTGSRRAIVGGISKLELFPPV